MSELNQADIDGARQAAIKAMFSDDDAGQVEAAAAIPPADIKAFFCQNWPMVKQVLQVIADQVGGPVPWFARALIAAGDVMHGRIC